MDEMNGSNHGSMGRARRERSLALGVALLFAGLFAGSVAGSLVWVEQAHAQPPATTEDLGVSPPQGDTGEGGEAQPPPPPQPPPQPPPPPPRPTSEGQCNDHRDDDGDGLTDCADADCFDSEFCHAGGRDERSNQACSDWIDNDGDGAVDCDDDDCSGDGITACQGSWSGRSPGGGGGNDAQSGGDDESLPALDGDMSVEDLIGTNGDNDGERNDYLCADGIDNDGDGRTDCQDFGCRFDPSVTVCAGTPGVRLSLVAGIGAWFNVNDSRVGDTTVTSDPLPDMNFTRLQLRALGPIPFINNSFFLINIRAEHQFRLTFAVFNVPFTPQGHYFSLYSGSGNLSTARIVSTSKHPLLEPAYYLFNRFERGGSAAFEVGGPIDEADTFRFRVMVAGGSGEFNGSVGGRFYRSDARNFNYSAGAQFQANLAGHYNRFDTPFLYTPVPLTSAILVGARFNQAEEERLVAYNAFWILRWWHFLISAEYYGGYDVDFDGVHSAFNIQLIALIVPRTLMLAADFGGTYSSDYGNLPAGFDFSSSFRRPLDQTEWRVALHWYYFRNIGILSLLYREDYFEQNPDNPEAPIVERELRLEAQFRF